MLLPNGNFQVGVHIADVSHFIRPGTAIDREAANRGTTVYLVDQVEHSFSRCIYLYIMLEIQLLNCALTFFSHLQRIDMIPDVLSSNLCSLKSEVDRFAFSALFEMTPDAKVINTKYCKSIIRSKNSFTYVEAQARIDDKSKNDEVTKGVCLL